MRSPERYEQFLPLAGLYYQNLTYLTIPIATVITAIATTSKIAEIAEKSSISEIAITACDQMESRLSKYALVNGGEGRGGVLCCKS